MYKLIKRDGNAKRGEFHTVHGVIQTPVFMNVGTAAAIKGAVSTEDLQQIGTQVELSNTYHLHVRPGDQVVKKMGGLGFTLIYIVVICAVMWFLLVRPQKKEQKRLDTMLASLAVGDSVVTTSGFYGVVIDLTDEDVIVEFGSNKNCRIPMKKSAIAEVEKAEESK